MEQDNYSRSSSAGSDNGLHDLFEHLQLPDAIGDQISEPSGLVDQSFGLLLHMPGHLQESPQPSAPHTHTGGSELSNGLFCSPEQPILPPSATHLAVLGAYENPMASGGQTEISCDGKCNSQLIGPHKCKRLQRRLRITCLSNDCNRIFTTKHDFNRHCRVRHMHGLSRLLDCSVTGCTRVGSRGFSRRDNLLQHMRCVHGQEILLQRFRVRPLC